MKELIAIPGKDPASASLLESGLYPSLAARQQKLWLTGSNVDFVDRAAEKAKGASVSGMIGEEITALSQSYVDGVRRAYVFGAGNAYKFDDGVGSQLGTSFNAAGAWSLLPWGTWLLATNGKDPVQVDKNTGSLVPLANVPWSTARCIRKLAERPIIFRKQEAAWPRATDIEYWTVPDTDGRAGNMFIRDLTSDIVAVEPFGESLAFYGSNQMGIVSFIGGAAVYGFKVRLTGIGALGLNVVVPVGPIHYGMSDSGAWRTDGSSYSYFDAPAINRFLDAIDKTLGDRIYGVHIQDRTTVEWYARRPDGTTIGLGYNYGNGSWSVLSKPVTALAPKEVFPYPLVASGINWGLYGSGSDMFGAALPSALTTGGFDAGEPNRFKWWDMVQVNWEGAGAIEVRFGLHRKETYGADASDRYTAWTALARENWVQQESVYLTMELRSTATGVTWRIGGLSVHGEYAGLAQ